MGMLASDVRRDGSLTASWDGATPAAEPSNTCVTVAQPANGSVVFQLTGTWSATITFEVSTGAALNASTITYVTVKATKLGASPAQATTATTNGIYVVHAPGCQYVRARCSGFVSGPIVVNGFGSVAPFDAVSAGFSAGGGGGGGATSGSLTNNNAAPGSDNLGVLGSIANAAAPSWSEGNLVALSTNLAGALRVILPGTSVVSGTGTFTVAGGKTNNNAAPGATNAGVLGAIANAAAPSWSEGNQVAQSVDLAGFQRGIVMGTVAGAGAAAGINPILTGFVGTGATIRNWTAANSVTATAGNDVPGVGGLVYNTTAPTWDRMRDTTSADNSSGTGLAGAGLVGWDGSVYRRVSVNSSGQFVLASSKAEDAGHVSGDSGVFALAVRQDTQSALAGTTLDYIPFTTDANGSQRTVAGGYTTVLTTTLTRPADTTAYTAGDEMTDTGGAIQTITGAARFSGGSGIIQGVYISQSTLWTTKPAMELWIYDTTSTPVADNGAFAPTDGVTDTCIAVIPVTATYAGTVNQALDSGQISVPFVTSGSANLFCRIVIRNAAQDSANSGVTKFRWRILQD